jgi:hypothetical protein
MDVNRLSTGQKIAGAAGLLLFIDLWMSWYGVDVSSITGVSSALVKASGVDTTASAWQAFGFTDILLAITAIVAMAMAVTTMNGTRLQLPVKLSSATAGLGALMTLIVLYRIVNQPGPNKLVTVQWGAYAGLILVALVAYGGVRSMGDEPAPVMTPATPV